MNQKIDKKLADAVATKTAAEKALLLADAAAKRAQSAKVEFRFAKRNWKLARKAARRTAKEARRAQKKLAKVACLLKGVKPKSKGRGAIKSFKLRRVRQKASASASPATPVDLHLLGDSPAPSPGQA